MDPMGKGMVVNDK
jgi:hypothetical protein